jgi:hypothetical protein
MIKIKKGSRLFYTVIGHKGFHYPSDDNSYLVTEDLEASPLLWVTQRGESKVPVSVRLPDDSATVMWVDKKDLD